MFIVMMNCDNVVGLFCVAWVAVATATDTMVINGIHERNITHKEEDAGPPVIYPRSSTPQDNFIEIPPMPKRKTSSTTMEIALVPVGGANCGKYSNGQIWDNATYPCVSYQCRNGVVQTTFHGCIWDGRCYNVDEAWNRSCAYMTCVSYRKEGSTVFEVQADLGCIWGDRCMAPNATWPDGCDEKQCVVSNHGNQRSSQVITKTPRCKRGKFCMAHGETWKENCIFYTCNITSAMKRMTVIPGCIHENKCYEIGQNRTMVTESTCITYHCTKETDGVGWTVIDYTCNYLGECRPSNSSWRDQNTCLEMTCYKMIIRGKRGLSLSTKKYGCRFNNTCTPIGGQWTDNSTCEEKVCKAFGSHAGPQVTNKMCKDATGTCIQGTSEPKCPSSMQHTAPTNITVSSTLHSPLRKTSGTLAKTLKKTVIKKVSNDTGTILPSMTIT